MAQLWPGQDGTTIQYISSAPCAAWQRSKRRSLTILGSTGSIGRSALDVIARNPDAFHIEGLACARNVTLLAKQALAYKPKQLAVLDEKAAQALASLLPSSYTPEILVGANGYKRIASNDASTVLSAQVGSAGLCGTLAAVLAGKVVCLANKESLVLAGDLMRHVCQRRSASILPVDSEHFALFDCLAGRGDEASELILTASGGPFRGFSKDDLRHVTPAMALKHPNWAMGAKITIDSATLMNKALEVIEACHLYGLPPEKVRVLVHPESIVHSLVAFKDGSQLAQLALPDMRLPIGACLLWPQAKRPLVEKLSLAKVGCLHFEELDANVFPAIELARKAMQVRGGMSIVLNTADEVAVGMFLDNKCSFLDITHAVAAAMENHLMSIREDSGTDAQSYCLPGDLLRLDGQDFDAACWDLVAQIEGLIAKTSSFVKEYIFRQSTRF